MPTNVPSSIDQVTQLQETRQETQEVLENLQQSKDAHKTMKMKVGDRVWLEGKNLSIRGTCKLLPKRYGLFKITERIGQVAYRLGLSLFMKVHNVFHIDLLLPYKEMEAYGQAYLRPTPDLIKGEEEYEVKSICDTRQYGQGRKLHYLVHWKGYPVSDDSWVDHKDLHAPELLEKYYKSTTAG